MHINKRNNNADNNIKIIILYELKKQPKNMFNNRGDLFFLSQKIFTINEFPLLKIAHHGGNDFFIT